MLDAYARCERQTDEKCVRQNTKKKLADLGQYKKKDKIKQNKNKLPSKKAGLVLIGDWPTGRRGALYSRAFYPGPAPPRDNAADCSVWKKIAVSGHDVADEERLGVENKKTRPAPGRGRGREKRWGEEGVKKSEK